ncbi:MAG: low molecular weight phosphotyrosine protein phosphatase, partial [Brevundimonas sp.]
HAGDPPDRRAQATALRHGIDISGYRGRQVTKADFRRFTHIVALDDQNLRDLKRLAPADATATLSLMLDHAPGRAGQAVADPYYGDDAGFETTWADVSAGAAGLVQALRTRSA